MLFGIEDFSKPIVDYNNFDVTQLGDVLLFGGAILLIGMVTVFAVLCLLWLCLALFKIFFHDIPEKRANAKATTQAIDSFESSYSFEPVKNDDEVIAVIAAAIAMAESENSDMKFRVVSFKKI